MIIRLADSIVSPIAIGSQENFEALRRGESRLQRYDNHWGVQEPFVASLASEEMILDACRQFGIDTSYSRFDRIVLLAVTLAQKDCNINLSSERVLFILSSTKGNVELLDLNESTTIDEASLTRSAQLLASHFGNPNTPLVVCNACISGLSAQVEAMRYLESGLYDEVVVVGADVQSKFIISGFQSFHAMSQDLCRPFDEDRLGLNLGEAAACVVYANRTKAEDGQWILEDGAVMNDAFHISSPSKTAEGSYRAIQQVMKGRSADELAMIGVHGTATMYNDEMESVAIARAGLTDVPVSALKGYYGHTMGAAGVLETVLSMKSVDAGIVLPSRGFAELGVSKAVKISSEEKQTDKRSFLKLMSGFGGCNAALLYRKADAATTEGSATTATECSATATSEASSTADYRYDADVRVTHRITVNPQTIVLDGETLPLSSQGNELLTEAYRQYVGDYPKFFKMDSLAKLGFVASELLLKAEKADKGANDTRAVVFFNRTASCHADQKYEQTIKDADNYFPSPALFVYTLPNIVTGEIALRNAYHGETSFLLLPSKDEDFILRHLHMVLAHSGSSSVIGGWVDYVSQDEFEASLFVLSK